MRKREVLGKANAIAFAGAPGGGAPFADAVEREDGRLLKWARKERAGGMAFVMIQEQERRAGARRKLVANRLAHEQLVFEPDRHRHAEAAKPARREREIGLQQTLKLRQGLFVEDDVVKLARRQARLIQTVS